MFFWDGFLAQANYTIYYVVPNQDNYAWSSLICLFGLFFLFLFWFGFVIVVFC